MTLHSEFQITSEIEQERPLQSLPIVHPECEPPYSHTLVKLTPESIPFRVSSRSLSFCGMTVLNQVLTSMSSHCTVLGGCFSRTSLENICPGLLLQVLTSTPVLISPVLTSSPDIASVNIAGVDFYPLSEGSVDPNFLPAVS